VARRLLRSWARAASPEAGGSHPPGRVPDTPANSGAGSIVAAADAAYFRGIRAPREVETMRQQQITKRTTRPIAAPLDLRTPTGRRLPF